MQCKEDVRRYSDIGLTFTFGLTNGKSNISDNARKGNQPEGGTTVQRKGKNIRSGRRVSNPHPEQNNLPAISRGSDEQETECHANENGLMDGDGIMDPGESMVQGLSDGNGLINGNGCLDNGRTGFPHVHLFPMNLPRFHGKPGNTGYLPFPSRFVNIWYTRRNWIKLLATATVLTIIFSSILFILYLNDPTGMVIDGDFSDWHGKTIVEDYTNDGFPDITRVGLHTDDIHLSIYVETATPMLEGFGSQGDTIRIFIDSDANGSTGYTILTIGADYLIEIHGNDQLILSSWYYQYDILYRTIEPRENHDWNAWSQMFSIDSEISDNKLEAQLWVDELSIPKGAIPRVLVQTETPFGSEDISPVLSEAGSIEVTTRSLLSDQIIASEKEIPVLKLQIRNLHPRGLIINSISFTLYSTLQDHEIASSKLYSDASAADYCARIEGGRLFFTTEEDLTDSVVSEWSYTLCITLTRTVIIGRALVLGLSTITTAAGITPFTEEKVRAYAISPPEFPVVDGLFSEWINTIADTKADCPEPAIDLISTGSIQSMKETHFFLEVDGNILKGKTAQSAHPKYVPMSRAGISHEEELMSSESDVHPLPRDTGEDIIYIFLDTVKGHGFRIGNGFFADRMIEIKGKYGTITSSNHYSFQGSLFDNGSWFPDGVVPTASDRSRIEAVISCSDILDSCFLVTSWNGIEDRDGNHEKSDPSNSGIKVDRSRSDETDVCINELFPNPVSESQEWIELYNPGDVSIDLLDWQLQDESGTIWTGGQDDSIDIDGTFIVQLNNKLRNSGEIVTLLDDGIQKDRVVYPTFSSYEGLSFTRIYDASEYFERDPTPTRDLKNAMDGIIKVNEILYDVSGSEPDGEFIELYNSDSQSRTLTEWKLRNDDRKTFDFTATITTEGFYVIDSDDLDLDSESYSDCFGLYGLGGSEDFVALENSLGQVVDRMTYASSDSSDYFNESGTSIAFFNSAPDVDEGNSLGRYPDGSDTDDDDSDFVECSGSKGNGNTPLREYATVVLPALTLMAYHVLFRRKRQKPRKGSHFWKIER